MSNPKTTSFRLSPFHVVCLALLALYAGFLISKSSAVAGGADSSGYLVSARLLTEGRLMMPMRTIPELPADDLWLYTPLGMVAGEPANMLRPTYPVGLPLHFALASLLLGWTWGPILVNVFGAVALVWLIYLCAREFEVHRLIAATAAASLGLSCILIFTSIQPLSDTLSATWNTAAFYFALRARRPGGWLWSVACGLAVAVAVLVRPTDALIIPALCLVLWHWKNLLGAGLGGLPGAVFLGWYNHTLYGSAFTTGYGDIFGLISLKWLAPSLSLYASWLPRVLPISVVAILVLPWLPWRSKPREMTALVLWFFAFAGFFAFYSCTHEVWWYLRFLLPAFPALAIIAAVGGNIVPRHAIARITIAAATVAATFGFGDHMLRSTGSYRMAEGQQPYEDLGLWARANLPADAAIATLHASGSLYFYTDFPMIRSDFINRERFIALTERLRASGRPLYALLYKYDDEPRRDEQIPGDWVEQKRVGDFSLWRLNLAP